PAAGRGERGEPAARQLIARVLLHQGLQQVSGSGLVAGRQPRARELRPELTVLPLVLLEAVQQAAQVLRQQTGRPRRLSAQLEQASANLVRVAQQGPRVALQERAHSLLERRRACSAPLAQQYRGVDRF